MVKAYIYAAALHCAECTARHVLGVPFGSLGAEIERQRKAHGIPDGASDTDNVPDGPHGDGGGESDSPAHCDTCRRFLRNPLTSDGRDYVRDAIREHNETGRGDRETLQTWRDFYGDSVQRFGMADLPELRTPDNGAGPYRVTRAASRTFGFDYGEHTFPTMAEALSHAKQIAHDIHEIAPGTGGSLFPRVYDSRGYSIPYEILTY